MNRVPKVPIDLGMLCDLGGNDIIRALGGDDILKGGLGKAKIIGGKGTSR
jgi:Ca2+-binding RTX toxin-like protein